MMVDLYVDKLYKAYVEAYNSALRTVVEVLPTLLKDNENVTVWEIQSEKYDPLKKLFEVHYNGENVASFCVSYENCAIYIKDMNFLYSDEALQYIIENEE